MLLGIYNNSIPGYSKGGKNFVCSQDVAVAAVNALVLGRMGECYIAGNENLSFKDFFTIASNQFKNLPCKVQLNRKIKQILKDILWFTYFLTSKY